VIVVNPEQIPASLPDELEGIATRIVHGGAAGPRGLFDMTTGSRIAPLNDTFAVSAISKTELLRAQAVNTAQASNLMKLPGVQGVGVTSSADAPGEAALMIFVVRGVSRNPIPVLIDGVRTRIRESSRFTAGHRGNETFAGCRVPQTPQLQRPSLTTTP